MIGDFTANSCWATLNINNQAGCGTGFQHQHLLFQTFLYQGYYMPLNFGNLY